MFPETLPENGENILKNLEESGLLKDFYLAGGTGLALQLGHRKSLDFDFFSLKDFDTQYYIVRLDDIGEFNLLNEAKGTVTGILNDIKISFFHYDYPLLWKLKNFNSIKLAEIREIGLMKFTAIAGRGTKKDFIDLYWVGNNILPLSELFPYFNKKYGDTYNLYHILKSLIYFEDAEKDREPEMLKQVEWENIKNFFLIEQGKIFKQYYE